MDRLLTMKIAPSTLLVLAIVVVNGAGAGSAFVSDQHQQQQRQRRPQTVSGRPLFGYRHEWGEGGGSNSNNQERESVGYGNEINQQRQGRPRGLTIPVLPAIPNALPLMMGSEIELDPPTLGQWQVLEESVVLHQHYLQGANLTAIDAAPVVAVIDEYTAALDEQGSTPHKKKERYATIAAVVGISASKNVPEERDFMEIMAGCRGSIQPLSSRIRLVGVGRARLTDFFYQMPTEELEVEGECDIDFVNDNDDDGDSAPPAIGEDRKDPVVMAEFSIMEDDEKSSLHSIASIGNKGARSPNMAPVFAIHEMAKYSNKVTRLHDDRRRLVNLLASAKRRLAEHNVFEDVDGIGTIARLGDNSDKDLLDETERLLQCDNYGLNYYSSFSSIPDLTGVAQEVLSDYYSPARKETEEYRLEVLSFVAFRSLHGFCSPSDLAWALTCTNSIERLNRAYDLMLDHLWSLKEMMKRANEDLDALGD